ncbi:hypothetical protein PENSTE_c010G08904 [Penicillium steckii]|uniref:Uncharacterized protein n=1 Tax=Penicillium steckii TaxID=303698 RepID=A0A1V6T858_9EURO|nr:hypothetical protein PENSTE_c010G08904 [Penicillium steckii]
MAAARAVLDGIHESLPVPTDDTNSYVLGDVHGHNVVIACLPTDHYGIVNAANVVTNIIRTFTSIRVGLMVGIGGGVPSKVDIRLGDVVVGIRVMQTDLGKIVADQHLERTAIPRIPHQLLGTAMTTLRAKHELEPSEIPSILKEKLEKYGYGHPCSPDRLFHADYHHEVPTASCDECDHSKLVSRSARLSNDPVIHYGAIASGSQVIKDSSFRDEAARRLNVICFEMEAAGLMDIPLVFQFGVFAIILIHTRAKNGKNHTPSQERQERRQVLLDSFRFDQIDARKLTVGKAHGKTCQWFLSHPDYKAWLNPEKLTQHHGFLWISGKPGAGKSTIMKFLYTNMKKQTRHKDSITASFFFNARGEYLEKSVIGMYRSLLLQLLEGYPDLQTVLDDPELLILSSQNQNVILSLDVLKDLLFKAVPLVGHRSFICFIDALDECDEQQVRDMIEYFEDLAERSTAKRVSFRICFSSRHYPYILTRWGTRLTLEHQPGHTEDLQAYIRGKLRTEDPEIVEEMLDKSVGVFMWVVLVVDILNREYARGAMSLKRKLQDLPAGLSDLFKDILKRDTNNMEELLLCFLWILCAERPLRPDEFYHALWSGLLQKGLVDTKIPGALVQDTSDGLPRSYRYVISCSKGLAEVTRSDTPSVQFIHESVRDFLIKDKGLYELWPQLGLDWESPSHERLKECCNIYRNREDVLEFMSKLPPHSKPSNCMEASMRYPFVEYANQNALYHANAAAKVIPQGIFLASLEVTSWVGINNLFEKTKIREYTLNANLLYILADKGYPELIRTRLKDFPDIHPFGERYGYPLFCALARADKASTAALLNLPSCFHDGVDITEGLNRRQDLTVSKNRRPLSWAAEDGRTVILKLLIERGEDFNAPDKDRCTPLSLALRNRHKAAARLLIQRGAPIGTTDRNGRTPFMSALVYGNNILAEILFEQGADIKTADRNGQTPLFYALDFGHYALAIKIIEKGADINSINLSGQAPLALASKNGYMAAARLLIQRGAPVNTTDQKGRTPLMMALENRHNMLAEMLFEQGADVKIADHNGQTPLLFAIKYEHHALAIKFFEKGAEINTIDKNGMTPLLVALKNGHENFARMLLERGAEINIIDQNGMTPLLVALKNGHENVARMLLERGAEINIIDQNGMTPLLVALKNGHENVARMLLERGAEINIIDQNGMTPLLVALKNGHENFARMLLKRGAKINASDQTKWTPLSLALRNGYESIATTLIKQGAEVNTIDEDGRTPLSRASASGYEAAVKLLIERGADPNARDINGKIPLEWAVMNGCETVVKLLQGQEASAKS